MIDYRARKWEKKNTEIIAQENGKKKNTEIGKHDLLVTGLDLNKRREQEVGTELIAW